MQNPIKIYQELPIINEIIFNRNEFTLPDDHRLVGGKTVKKAVADQNKNPKWEEKQVVRLIPNFEGDKLRYQLVSSTLHFVTKNEIDREQAGNAAYVCSLVETSDDHYIFGLRGDGVVEGQGHLNILAGPINYDGTHFVDEKPNPRRAVQLYLNERFGIRLTEDPQSKFLFGSTQEPAPSHLYYTRLIEDTQTVTQRFDDTIGRQETSIFSSLIAVPNTRDGLDATLNGEYNLRGPLKAILEYELEKK